ncbi:peptide chain release factor N(5)-glutamine methyltransferase [Thalassobacillus hwangdonensis]|uniref:Release factor glutamine methyltransferase n=1 Tax=Thalassobacillus hwangdonensis TaxID=546108 RepID=A0ABW3L3Z7_9BACI
MDITFKTIQEARKWASLFLQEHDREPRVADLLLEHHLNMSYTQLLAYGRDPFPEMIKEFFVADIVRHCDTGVPVQHLIGQAAFYGRSFHVNEHVLIPRPETEELVEGVLQFALDHHLKSPVIVDLGTGSGAIACSLSLDLPESNVYATDISEQALAIAEQNATQLGAKVTFKQGDFLAPLVDGLDTVDIIVSNPPYISEEEASELSETVKNFDPSLALFADEDGLAAYRKILMQIQESAYQPALIAFEIGHTQADAISILVKQITTYHPEVRKDINGKDRMIFCTPTSF